MSTFESLSVRQLKHLLNAKCCSAHGYSEKKRTIILAVMEKMKEKEALVKLVRENVQPDEVEILLASQPPISSSSESSSSGNSSRSSSSKKQRERAEKAKAALDNHNMPSPEMLRKQAREMSRNPDMVRRANPQFRNLTDAQIREQAREMEKMANNPEALREMMRMQNMPDEDKKSLTRLQEGLQGIIPRDEKWIDDSIKMVKANPNLLKSMFKGRIPKEAGMTEEQVLGFIDFVVSLSDWILKLAIQIINWCIEMRGPVGAYYQKADDMTLGCAKYILMAIAAFIMWYTGKAIWYVFSLLFGLIMMGYRTLSGASAGAAEGVTNSVGSPSEGQKGGEFDEF